MMTFTQVILYIATAAILGDLVLMVLSFKKHTPTGKTLGFTLASCLYCTLSYFCSIFITDINAYALLQGIYFCGVTTSLISILRFMIIYTDVESSPKIRRIWQGVLWVGLFDCVI